MFQVNGSRYTARDLKVLQAQGLDPAGDCLAPVQVYYRGSPDPVRVNLCLEKADSHAVTFMDVRCRKCATCLKHRGRLWTARAIAECAVSTRTWFITLTVEPFARVRATYAADLRNSRRAGGQWSELSEDEQFKKISEQLAPELTRFLKRLRKNSGAKLRYLLVPEAHKDGFPHFHMLLHEHGGNCTKRTIEKAWLLGYSQARLVPLGEVNAARYLCKYLTKSALTRVRASQRYGQVATFAHFMAERISDIANRLPKKAD